MDWMLTPLNDVELESSILQQINKIMPNETFNKKLRPDIDEDYVDLMQTHNLTHKSQTSMNINQRQATGEMTQLKMLRGHVGRKSGKD